MGETTDTFDLSLLDEVFAKYEGKKGTLIPILQQRAGDLRLPAAGGPASHRRPT